MDNHDGTLSLFGTLTDFGAPLGIRLGAAASGFGHSQMGSLSHAIAFNEPQAGDGAGEERLRTRTRNSPWTTRARTRSRARRGTT